MTDVILDMLKRADDYISGEEIARELDVTRTAVWKNMNKLKAMGYRISSVPNKGYILLDSGDMLNTQEVDYDNCVFFEETESTNTEAKKLAESGCADGTMVLCNVQRAGRGRLGRSWSADEGSLCTSIVLRPSISPMQAPMLTLISGLAVAYAISEVSDISAGIKWPNDVIAEGRKVSGILTELSTEMERVSYVIVGIGINVNNTKFNDELRDKAGSLFTLTGKSYSRAKLATALIKQLIRLYELFEERGFPAVRDEYNSLCLNVGKRCETLDGTIKGECLGIDDEGRLELKTDSGSIERIFTGEVSLRLADGKYI